MRMAGRFLMIQMRLNWTGRFGEFAKISFAILCYLFGCSWSSHHGDKNI